LTSAAKAESNRANAKASTGPKTVQGRARAARNAFRHGLSVSVVSDLGLMAEGEDLAREIAGPNATPEVQDLAWRVAQAQIDLRRVRYARHQLLARHLISDHADRIAGQKPPDTLAVIRRSGTSEEPKKFAIPSQEAKQLSALDRYERRALSRRKFAIRELDRELAACAEALS